MDPGFRRDTVYGSGSTAPGRKPDLARIQLGIPVEIVAPALVQVVGREGAAVFLQHVGRRLDRALPRVHPALLRQAGVLSQNSAGAGGGQPAPPPSAPPPTRHPPVADPIQR